MGQLATFMTALKELNASVHPDLRAYVIRPRGQIDSPAVYALIPEGTFDRLDTQNGQDELTVAVRIAVNRTDPEEEAAELLRFTDLYLETIDAALWNDPPGGADECKRLGIRTVPEAFNGIEYLAIEFPIRVRLMRGLHPNP